MSRAIRVIFAVVIGWAVQETVWAAFRPLLPLAWFCIFLYATAELLTLGPIQSRLSSWKKRGRMTYLAAFVAAGCLGLLFWRVALKISQQTDPNTVPPKQPSATAEAPREAIPPGMPEPVAPQPTPSPEPLPQTKPPQDQDVREPAVVARVSIVSQERIPSFDKDFPFGWKVVVQTNVVIQPVSIIFRCDGEIGKGEVEFAGDAGSMFFKVRSGVILDQRDMFLASFESPAFTPEKAMLVMLVSKTPIKVVEFFQTPFRFP